MKTPIDQTTRASLELLFHISREIAATLDLDAVLQRVLFLSMKNIGAFSGSIIALNENAKPVASTIIHDKRIIEQPNQQLRVILNHGLAGWVVHHRQAVLIPDTSRDERWLQRPDDEEISPEGKSAISVPFVARDKVTGVITLVYRKPNYFKLEHLELVQAIADQAAVAVLNAHLYTESQRQAHVMTILAKSATAITASLDRDDVYQQVLLQTRNALHVDAVSLALIDHSNKEIVFKASTLQGVQNITGVRYPLGQGIAGWVAENGQGTIVQDVHQDPRYYPIIDQSTGFSTYASACAPIHFRGEIIGVIEALNPSKGYFDSDALVVITGIGSLAGSAIQHAQHLADLQVAHQRYHDLFQRNINSMLITNWEGKVLEGNREASNLFGYDQKTLQHMKIGQLHHLDHEKLGSRFSNLSSGQTVTYETQIRTGKKSEIPAEVRVHAIKAETSSYLQWVFLNIQDRKELEQLREDLLSSIYHDLRSPLSNVISSLDVLANMLSLEGNPAIHSLFNIAVRSTERIQRLTNSLLDISRLEAGQPIINLKPIEARILVQDTLDTVSPIAENKNQFIHAKLSDDLPAVIVDFDMIRRVLINLTENAIKYTPPEGTIEIGTHYDGERMLIWVEDTGPGIPPEKRMSIFDKFTRLNRDGDHGGFGFGLAYCRMAVEGHGGRIWVEESQKSGARFVFTLPVNDELNKE